MLEPMQLPVTTLQGRLVEVYSMRESAQIKSACNELFLLPKKYEKKLKLSPDFFGVFPLKEKYVEEPVWALFLSLLLAL